MVSTPSSAYQEGNAIPVNVLPKMSSSGGTSSFGVMVSVIESFEGSSPERLLIELSAVCKLYALWQAGFATNLDRQDDVFECAMHSCALLRRSLGISMLSRRHQNTARKLSALPRFRSSDSNALQFTLKSHYLNLQNHLKERCRRPARPAASNRCLAAL